MARRISLLLSCVIFAGAAACSRPVDLKQALTVTAVSSGWYDAGIVDGKNKLVPSLTVQITKKTTDGLRPLSLNFAFKRLGAAGSQTAEEDWDEVYVQSIAFNGNQTAPLTVRAKAGYTGDPPQSRADMLRNSQFRDIRVHVFAKHSSSNWVEVATFVLPRQLLTE